MILVMPMRRAKQSIITSVQQRMGRPSLKYISLNQNLEIAIPTILRISLHASLIPITIPSLEETTYQLVVHHHLEHPPKHQVTLQIIRQHPTL